MQPQKPKNTAVPMGATSTIKPFGPVEFVKPDRYTVNYGKGAARNTVTGINAFTARVPVLIGAMGSITLSVVCYLNPQPEGDPKPNLAWPRFTPADERAKNAIFAHIVSEKQKWSAYHSTLAAADKHLRAAQRGETLATDKAATELDYVREPEPEPATVVESLGTTDEPEPASEPASKA